jgi:putative peptidoglycan lipid II flippase
MWALAPQIVNVLYGWGKANERPEDLASMAITLRVYCWGVFAWCAQPILMRGFFSLHKTFKPIAISTAMTVLFIILCATATVQSPNYNLLAMATNVAAIVLAIALFVALQRQVGSLNSKAVGATIIQSALGALIAAAVAYGGAMLWQPTGRGMEILSLVILGLAAVWVYYFATKKLGMREAQYVANAIERRRTKENAPPDPIAPTEDDPNP